MHLKMFPDVRSGKCYNTLPILITSVLVTAVQRRDVFRLLTALLTGLQIVALAVTGTPLGTFLLTYHAITLPDFIYNYCSLLSGIQMNNIRPNLWLWCICVIFMTTDIDSPSNSFTLS